MLIQFPDVLRIEERVLGNPIRQLAERDLSANETLVPFTRNKRTGGLFTPDAGPEVIVTADARFAQSGDQRVVVLPKGDALGTDLRRGVWLKHPSRINAPDLPAECARTRSSWASAFHYIEENA